jgi:hypothetical protein
MSQHSKIRDFYGSTSWHLFLEFSPFATIGNCGPIIPENEQLCQNERQKWKAYLNISKNAL